MRRAFPRFQAQPSDYTPPDNLPAPDRRRGGRARGMRGRVRKRAGGRGRGGNIAMSVEEVEREIFNKVSRDRTGFGSWGKGGVWWRLMIGVEPCEYIE
eukprot:672755-Amorphochlora_amoeboformis.AAC.1